MNVTANGAEFASLGLGETFTGGIKPGPVTLTTSMWSTPGSYTVHFNAEAGKRYAFELQPRGAGLALASAGIFGSVVDAAANGEQSGPYKLVEVPVPPGSARFSRDTRYRQFTFLLGAIGPPRHSR